MWRERTNLFPCRKTQFCDTLKRLAGASLFSYNGFFTIAA